MPLCWRARESPRPAAKRDDRLACAPKRNAEELALSKDAPENEDWAAVGRAIRERMRELWDLTHATRAGNWIVTNDYPSYRRADD